MYMYFKGIQGQTEGAPSGQCWKNLNKIYNCSLDYKKNNLNIY